MARAETFQDDETEVEVEILSTPTSTGLCKVRLGEKILVRHRDRLRPLDEEAKRILSKPL